MNKIYDIAPPPNCAICPRLKDFRLNNRAIHPTWFNSPVPIFQPINGLENAKLLIVGLAPGLQGANRTGRPFTGDYAGILLYSSLIKYGFAIGEYKAAIDDSLSLQDTAIVNAVRCVPPQNKPLGSEINNCRQFLNPILYNLPNLKIILALGTIAHNTVLRSFNLPISSYKFRHNSKYEIKANSKILISSYHCSRYNTNTGRLTTQMFYDVFDNIIQSLT